LRAAAKNPLDLIAVDAGSIDPGPYYLGSGRSYMDRPQVLGSFLLLFRLAVEQDCPLVIGSCGTAGAAPHLAFMVDIAREAIGALGLRDFPVATIEAGVAPELLVANRAALTPLGPMPPMIDRDLTESRVVGQMGIAPITTALEEGAKLVLAGRACDVALFAADPVRRGYDPALAFQAGHILECGAMAAEPPQGMDCLVAEFRDDASVVFLSPNEARITTPHSLAAHTLWEEPHPTRQHYPEGTLDLATTEYFQETATVAGLRGGAFHPRDNGIKLEGSRMVGYRVVSAAFVADLGRIPPHLPVYGRNGVEERPADEGECEMGLLVRVEGERREQVEPVATLFKSILLHHDYPGRISTAGNLALPLSPSQVAYRTREGGWGMVVVGGSRDPIFQEQLENTVTAARQSVEQELPEAARHCMVTLDRADAKKPLLWLETVAETEAEALARHQSELAALGSALADDPAQVRAALAGPVYVWSLYHVLHEPTTAKSFFPVQLYSCDSSDWAPLRTVMPRPLEVQGVAALPDERTTSTVRIESAVHRGGKGGPLARLARVVRSKNAGVNALTYEIYFHDASGFEKAVESGIFDPAAAAELLAVPVGRIAGCYAIAACHAIKITVYRDRPSGCPGERDVFGAQQHSRLLHLTVPGG
jgi:hypothetical protein